MKSDRIIPKRAVDQWLRDHPVIVQVVRYLALGERTLAKSLLAFHLHYDPAHRISRNFGVLVNRMHTLNN